MLVIYKLLRILFSLWESTGSPLAKFWNMKPCLCCSSKLFRTHFDIIFFPLSHELEIHVVYMPADILNWYVDRCRQLGFDCEAARILKACCYPLLNDKTQARDPATSIPSFSFISLLEPFSSSFLFLSFIYFMF